MSFFLDSWAPLLFDVLAVKGKLMGYLLGEPRIYLCTCAANVQCQCCVWVLAKQKIMGQRLVDDWVLCINKGDYSLHSVMGLVACDL